MQSQRLGAKSVIIELLEGFVNWAGEVLGTFIGVLALIGIIGLFVVFVLLRKRTKRRHRARG